MESRSPAVSTSTRTTAHSRHSCTPSWTSGPFALPGEAMPEYRTKCAACGGADEFEAQGALARLADRVERLASVVEQLAANAPPPVQRAPSPEAAAAALDSRRPRPPGLAPVIQRIVGGSPTIAYPECCLIGARNPNGTTDWFCTGVLVHPRIVQIGRAHV